MSQLIVQRVWSRMKAAERHCSCGTLLLIAPVNESCSGYATIVALQKGILPEWEQRGSLDEARKGVRQEAPFCNQDRNNSYKLMDRFI